MNLFDQYGIKEVADVTIYSIHKKEDGSGDIYYVPALYLDTLKVTTTEKTAENTWAQGGLGNSRLISWDYGKTINLTLEDALCTPASLGLCWGGILSADWKDGQVNHQTGIQNMDCAMERIVRMEKAFYPRNDTVNAVVSNLLPRDGQEDILLDQHGDPVYLQRSSILDGVNVKGFGYVDSKPYKWHLEIESAVKSVAVVPDRFFSIYGKSYPIKRKQTVGINQPSESFKYEIIYMRGYDEYDDENPEAKIIYHRQAESNICDMNTCASDREALAYLDDFDNYPFLKIRVCWDGSTKAYLGSNDVDWDGWRMVEDGHVPTDSAWIEIPQINTDQFRHMDLWVRFDSLNALSYYLITKYEHNIFDIGPKDIANSKIAATSKELTYITFPVEKKITATLKAPDDNPEVTVWGKEGETGEVTQTTMNMGGININTVTINPGTYYLEILDASVTIENKSKMLLQLLRKLQGSSQYLWVNVSGGPQGLTSYAAVDINELIEKKYELDPITDSDSYVFITSTEKGRFAKVNQVAGRDYDLVDPTWADETNQCTPCCKKDNLSRAIWAYVNPKTMTPYDDDYWFHQGEPYYKQSLTISTKQNPLKAQKIFVEQGVFPGMYKIVAETLIRERDTGEDQRVQISLPLCKIKSDQTLTLQADGDPTTFNLDVEVATPKNGVPMEITFYEVEKEMKVGCSGNRIQKDGSTKISAK